MTHRDLILIRFAGEVCTKARPTRLRFVKKIEAAAADALLSAGIEHAIERRWSRIFVAADEGAKERLRRIFGVQSVSSVTAVKWRTLDDLVAAGREAFTGAVTGRTFAVRARRSGNTQGLGFGSPDVERAVGSVLLDASAGVDLDAPEVVVQVEVHAEDAYLFSEVEPAAGGLPMGIEGRALALVSGGFDSPVAAWRMLRRGVALDYLFFDLGGEPHERGLAEVLDVLGRDWSFGDWPRLVTVDLRPLVARIQRTVRPRFWQLALKWAMYRVAEAMAERMGLPALVTGESMGQVSSQTLHNLTALSRSVRIPVLRPLVGMSKEEIVAQAREIGTHDASAANAEYCALQADHPETAVRPSTFETEMGRLAPLPIEEILAGQRVEQLRRRAPGDGDSLAVAPAAIPPDATLVDLRSAEAFRRWHPQGAIHLDFFEALAGWPHFDRAAPYVVYCEVGFKSAHLAEAMRGGGFKAAHVPGGATALRRHAATADDRKVAG